MQRLPAALKAARQALEVQGDQPPDLDPLLALSVLPLSDAELRQQVGSLSGKEQGAQHGCEGHQQLQRQMQALQALEQLQGTRPSDGAQGGAAPAVVPDAADPISLAISKLRQDVAEARRLRLAGLRERLVPLLQREQGVAARASEAAGLLLPYALAMPLQVRESWKGLGISAWWHC